MTTESTGAAQVEDVDDTTINGGPSAVTSSAASKDSVNCSSNNGEQLSTASDPLHHHQVLAVSEVQGRCMWHEHFVIWRGQEIMEMSTTIKTGTADHE